MTNEITEESLKNRIRMAFIASGGEPAEDLSDQFKDVVDQFYNDGKFAEIVGVVGKTVTEERNRAAATARRLGHAQTARVIQEGK